MRFPKERAELPACGRRLARRLLRGWCRLGRRDASRGESCCGFCRCCVTCIHPSAVGLEVASDLLLTRSGSHDTFASKPSEQFSAGPEVFYTSLLSSFPQGSTRFPWEAHKQGMEGIVSHRLWSEADCSGDEVEELPPLHTNLSHPHSLSQLFQYCEPEGH